jgi:hypothetical protein
MFNQQEGHHLAQQFIFPSLATEYDAKLPASLQTNTSHDLQCWFDLILPKWMIEKRLSGKGQEFVVYLMSAKGWRSPLLGDTHQHQSPTKAGHSRQKIEHKGSRDDPEKTINPIPNLLHIG